MKKQERETYERLVIESLKNRKKDYSDLVDDVFAGWRAFNLKQNLNSPARPLKLVKHELSTEILTSMFHEGKITLDDGYYGLNGKAYL